MPERARFKGDGRGEGVITCLLSGDRCWIAPRRTDTSEKSTKKPASSRPTAQGPRETASKPPSSSASPILSAMSASPARRPSSESPAIKSRAPRPSSFSMSRASLPDRRPFFLPVGIQNKKGAYGRLHPLGYMRWRRERGISTFLVHKSLKNQRFRLFTARLSSPQLHDISLF